MVVASFLLRLVFGITWCEVASDCTLYSKFACLYLLVIESEHTFQSSGFREGALHVIGLWMMGGLRGGVFP